MSSVVLDASAVLAIVRGEPGSEMAASHLPGALMSAVNYAEVLKKSMEIGGSAVVTANLIKQAEVAILPFDEIQAVHTAELSMATRALGLSFADRACLVLGITHKATIMTTDERMSKADVPVKITLLRERSKPATKV